VISIVMCLSKWIDKDNSQGFDICIMQWPLALREGIAPATVELGKEALPALSR
jgi:hypothetical protein